MLLRIASAAIWIVFALFVSLAIFNWQPVLLTCCGIDRQAPLSLVVIVAMVVGTLAGFSLAIAGRAQLQRPGQQLEWAAQDAKLMAEVRSDREKQLEAKIATLETALKQALSKKR